MNKFTRSVGLSLTAMLTLGACNLLGVPADTTLPTVALSLSSGTVTAPGSVTATATATDDVAVQQVEFYLDSVLVATDTSAPYTYTASFTAAQVGSHTIKAKAIDTSSNAAEASKPVTVTAAPPAGPTVALTLSTATLSAAGDVTFTASASSSQGVKNVAFYDGTTLLSTDTTAPYAHTKGYTRADNGAHAIRAVVTDNANRTATDTQTLTVSVPAPAADTTPPQVTLIPSSNILTRAGKVTFTANATDNVGIASVIFEDNGAVISTDTTAPYQAEVSYGINNNGPHLIRAYVTDTSGNSAQATTTVTVLIAPATPAANAGTINGVRVIDGTTYQLGFTPLLGPNIVTNAQLQSVSLSNLSAGTATATICGQVQAQSNLTAAINLDSTGSMASTDPNELRNAAAKSFVARMTPLDQAAVLSFDTGTAPSAGLSVSKLWQDFTSNQAALNTSIDQATFDGGATPLFSAIADASNVVVGKGPNPKVLILTDGQSNSGISAAQAIAIAKANNTPVYAIGLDAFNSLNFAALEQVASQTGGLFQKATSAAQLQTLFDGMFNAFRAQGCIQVNFTAVPAPGTVVTGTLAIVVTAPNTAPATVNVPFTLTIR